MNTTPTHPRRRWLVVDDNAQVAELLVKLLGGLGLATIEKFTSSRDAYARTHAASVDLVVTARDMPGLDGLELSRWLHAESPATKIILIAAHTEDLTTDELRRAGVCGVFPKPFSPSRLAALVRSLACERASDPGSLDFPVARRAA